MQITLFAGSLRQDSFNHQLAQVAAAQLRAQGHTTNLLRLKSYELPLMDEDLEAQGLPPGVERLGKDLAQAQAIVICAPEYNGGISGVLKNTLDWLSRLDEVPLSDKPLLLLGASPGMLGAVRGLWHTRVPFEAIGAWVYPSMFGLGGAHQAFDGTADAPTLKDPKQSARLNALLKEFETFASHKI